MSIGFRIFLLILFGFGAIYAYRFREAQLLHWLRRATPPVSEAAADGLVSPVDRVLDSEVTISRLVGQPLVKAPRPARRDGASTDSFAAGLSQEDQLDAADLADGGQGSWADEEEAATAEPTQEAELAPEAAEAPRDPGNRIDPAPEPRAESQVEGTVEVATYKVEAGDNLWKIAAKCLGSGARFGEIRAMNPEVFRGQSSDALGIGTVLKVPLRTNQESLKVPPPPADSTVERNSTNGPQADPRKPSRPSVKPIENPRKLAGK